MVKYCSGHVSVYVDWKLCYWQCNKYNSRSSTDPLKGVLEINWHHIIPKGNKIHSHLNIFHFEMDPLICTNWFKGFKLITGQKSPVFLGTRKNIWNKLIRTGRDLPSSPLVWSLVISSMSCFSLSLEGGGLGNTDWTGRVSNWNGLQDPRVTGDFAPDVKVM